MGFYHGTCRKCGGHMLVITREGLETGETSCDNGCEKEQT